MNVLTSFAGRAGETGGLALAVARGVEVVVEVRQAERGRAALHGVGVEERDAEEAEEVGHAPGPVSFRFHIPNTSSTKTQDSMNT